MNLRQLYEILIINQKKLPIFKSKIRIQEYRTYFFNLFPLSEKKIVYRDPSSGITSTINLNDLNEKNKKTQINKLIEIWNKAIIEINSKKLNIGHLKYETILGKKVTITNHDIENLLNIYMTNLNLGKSFEDSREIVYEELAKLNEPEEIKNSYYPIINNLIKLINEKLEKVGIEIS